MWFTVAASPDILLEAVQLKDEFKLWVRSLSVLIRDMLLCCYVTCCYVAELARPGPGQRKPVSVVCWVFCRSIRFTGMLCPVAPQHKVMQLLGGDHAKLAAEVEKYDLPQASSAEDE